MPLYLTKGDITNMHCDAVVNATDPVMSGGGGVDRAIHEAAGHNFIDELKKNGPLEVGDARITPAYELDARYIIHTVGPVWGGGNPYDTEILASCYRRSLKLAFEYGCETIAFPLISAGTFGFPEDDALLIAKNTILDFLEWHDMVVYLVAYRSHTYNLGSKIFSDITRYVDRNYTGPETLDSGFFESDYCLSEADSAFSDYSETCNCAPLDYPDAVFGSAVERNIPNGAFMPNASRAFASKAMPKSSAKSLDDLLDRIDESFAEMLMRKIKESGMTNSECYNKALISKSVFSKIKNNPEYKPTKPTVIAFAIALHLSLADTIDMLGKAGYSFTHSNKFDIIIEYFINNNIYNIYQINETLYDFDQVLLGF